MADSNTETKTQEVVASAATTEPPKENLMTKVHPSLAGNHFCILERGRLLKVAVCRSRTLELLGLSLTLLGSLCTSPHLLLNPERRGKLVQSLQASCWF